MDSINLNGGEVARLINNFYVSKGLDNQVPRIPLDAELLQYVLINHNSLKPLKIAFCNICVNPAYWEFIKPLIDGARNAFLPGHQVDFLIWSDIPKEIDIEKTEKEILVHHTKHPRDLSIEQLTLIAKESTQKAIESAKTVESMTLFPIEAIEWPMPTLMRYHTMLQQEEKLKEYDYIFYCDIDMMFNSIVGDEILGKRLTAVLQPMYAIRKEWWPPYEPNPKSASYIPRPAKYIKEPNGLPRLMPIYLAGGFQGGKSDAFISAMKVMKQKIDTDMNKNNYIPIWNDEAVWNSYLFENPSDDDIILSPSYTYPDQLIEEYFKPIWGQDYFPKLVTLTKKFTLISGGNSNLIKMLDGNKKLK